MTAGTTPAAPGVVVPESAMTAARRSGVITEPLAERIDRDAYTPALINLVSNALIWGGTRVYQHAVGLGTPEWRVLSALAIDPGATVTDLVAILGMNKSIASRSLTKLTTLGLVQQFDGQRGSRHTFLTQEGVTAHATVLPLALQRESIIQADLSPKEIQQLHAILLKLLARVGDLGEFERQLVKASKPQAADSQRPARSSGSSRPKRTTKSSKAVPGA